MQMEALSCDYAREKGVTPHARAGYTIPLSEFQRLAQPVTLAQIRNLVPAIGSLIADLKRKYGEPLGAPTCCRACSKPFVHWCIRGDDDRYGGRFEELFQEAFNNEFKEIVAQKCAQDFGTVLRLRWFIVGSCSGARHIRAWMLLASLLLAQQRRRLAHRGPCHAVS
jgi:hypothetical protein